MALVALLRGVNVGGHRTFRPKALAGMLQHLDAINIGAAGTFVIRRRISRATVQAELADRLPFRTEIIVCTGEEIARLVAQDWFAGEPARSDTVRFVSVLAKRTRTLPEIPMRLPARGTWLLKIIARDGRFVLGVYRRHMRAIGYLGRVDQLFGVPSTTRNWNTMTAIAGALRPGGSPTRGKSSI